MKGPLVDSQPLQMVKDTAWVANSTAGDKTAVVAALAGGTIDGTMVTALNVVSAGLGTALAALEASQVLVVKKLAALETALATGKLPNA